MKAKSGIVVNGKVFTCTHFKLPRLHFRSWRSARHVFVCTHAVAIHRNQTERGQCEPKARLGSPSGNPGGTRSGRVQAAASCGPEVFPNRGAGAPEGAARKTAHLARCIEDLNSAVKGVRPFLSNSKDVAGYPHAVLTLTRATDNPCSSVYTIEKLRNTIRECR